MPVPLVARADSQPKGLQTGSNNPVIIGIAIAVGAVFVGIAVYVYVAKRRPPNYSTTPKQTQWRRWKVGRSRVGRFLHLKSTNASIRSHDMEETSYAPSTTTNEPSNRSINENPTTADGVNRNTSVRSIVTLPPYHPTPHPHERLIAREGERAGVDTVIEFPETAEEEEERREEEMDSLYQIREARRREQNERNERRRERQEAREAGDWARLEQLRLQSEMRARARAESTGSVDSSAADMPAATRTTTNASSLLAEHRARAASRERRVSSVSYAELGLARHDGSRLRADSVDSDHRPLLDSAASMGSDNRNLPSSRRGSLWNTHTTHNRAPSAESVLTTDSDFATELTPHTSSDGRSGSDRAARTPSASGQDTNSEPSPPIGEPPRYDNEEYEEAPPYTSPIAERGENVPRLPSVRVDSSLPAIQIIGSTPAATPIVGRDEEEHRIE